ncbi:hypothetical protein GCM10010317_064910 [Streptomyces mirabilis]|nr:hypothetical protein GCM10010317_064910 [Streptomyces mirabilis]
MVGHEQCRHPRLSHPQAHPVTGHPGLGDLEEGLSDAVAVPDADLVVRQAVDGEVLTELAGTQVVAPQLFRPEAVRVELVHQHRPLLTAVPAQISLPVPVDVQPSHHPRPGNRVLVDAGVNGPAMPGNVFRHPDIHCCQRGHHATSPVAASPAAVAGKRL